MLQGLEGEDGGADIAGFPIPDKLDLPLILKEEETVFLGQGPPLLDELDEIALLGLGQVVSGIVAGHGWGFEII